MDHFERRLEAMDGKAMIVCMSRRICVDLYNEIVKLRPRWHNEDDEKGVHQDRDDRHRLRSDSTGSSTSATNARRRQLAKRFKNPNDPFKIVIVRDMWLTGFDVPCLHTMYVDKPMRGHGLMQAIARVNRVFRDKPGGLVVDYLGLADQLKQALATYTESGGQGKPSIDTEEAVAVMLEKYEVCCDMMHGFDWSKWTTGTPAQRLGLLPPAQEHILQQEDGKPRFHQRRDRSVAGVRPLCRPRRGHPHPRRHRLLPGRARRPGEAIRRAEERRRPRPGRSAVGLEGHHRARMK